VQAHRARGSGTPIGITLNLFPTYPLTQDPADVEAARGSEAYTNGWFLEPLYRGRYPADTVRRFETAGVPFDVVADGDLETIATATDFLGVNYYSPRRVRAAPDEFGWAVQPGAQSGAPVTAIGGEIHPPGLTDLLIDLERDYGPLPIYITENGMALEDEVAPDGAVHDAARIEFLEAHVDAAHRAIEHGVDLRGYFVWSFMDNFEWAMGYGPRLGLVFVDYATQRRIPKDSFAWMRSLALARRANEPGRRSVGEPA
jgi:beta-glucosidase